MTNPEYAANPQWHKIVYGSGAGESIERKRRKPRKYIRDFIVQLQQGKCAYCDCPLSRETTAWDHFKPFCLFGNLTQFVAACRRCNGIKGDVWFDEFAQVRAFIQRRINEKLQAKRKR